MSDSELQQLASKVGISTDRLVGVGNRLITSIETGSKSQEKHQKSIVALTVVIALSTVIYTLLTIWSTSIQQQELELKLDNDSKKTTETTVKSNT
ncbi:MAG: hypothetical protein HRU20_15975 [Pseudomonadales bacterium]|nr:hypothetical protein [Pseudomonadales bacterium]